MSKRRRRIKKDPERDHKRSAAAGLPMSIASFARDRGVDEKAVRKAITSGRIPAAFLGLSVSGRKRVIADVAGARLAWDANAAKVPPGPAAVDGERQSLSEASRQATMERFRKLRIENDLREGAVVDVRAAKREAFESARIIRETLLNLPIRLAAELAGETDPAKVFARLDDAIRQALGDVADRLEAAGE